MKHSPRPTLIRALTKFRDDLKAGRGLDHYKQTMIRPSTGTRVVIEPKKGPR